MKKTFILFILLIPIFIFSQKFTLSNLVNLASYNNDNFDTFVISKGYVFNKTESDEQSATKFYSFSTNKYERNKAAYWISKTNYNDGKVIVSWTTYKSEDYAAIKSQIKANGFQFTEESNTDGIIGFHYKNGKYELSLYVEELTFDNSIKDNGYEISIVKH